MVITITCMHTPLPFWRKLELESEVIFLFAACLVDVVEEELGQAGLEDKWTSGVLIEAPAQLALYQVRDILKTTTRKGETSVDSLLQQV